RDTGWSSPPGTARSARPAAGRRLRSGTGCRSSGPGSGTRWGCCSTPPLRGWRGPEGPVRAAYARRMDFAPEGISRTSQAVALTRAELDRPHSPEGAPRAQARLCAGMRPAPVERLRPMLTARTRFFDEAVTTALAGGTDQVGICGAGEDERA